MKKRNLIIFYVIFSFFSINLISLIMLIKPSIDFEDPNWQSKTLRLSRQGWRWHEQSMFIYKIDEFGQFKSQPAMFGLYARNNLRVELGFDGKKPYINAIDSNTNESIKVEYGIHFIYPIFVYRTQEETRRIDFDWNNINGKLEERI